MRHKKYDSGTSFLDLLFNSLLGFVAMTVLAFSLMNVNKQNKNMESKAEFIITVTWPKELDYDVDTYVEDPEGHLVCFRRREDGLMHLDRDDLGKRNDKIQTPYGVVEYNENKEVVTIRGYVPGEYVVNLHMYMAHGTEECPVTVQVEKVNPFALVTSKKVILSKNGEEKTAVRFTVNDKGLITSLGDLPKKLTTVVPPHDDFNENTP
jgi:hypothetical protein